MRHKLKDVSTGLIAGIIVCGLCNPLFISGEGKTYNYDVNNDGVINVLDLNCIKTYLFNRTENSETTSETTNASATESYPAEPLISMQEPVRKLSSLHAAGTVTNICTGGNHTVIVQYGTETEKEYSVVDLLNDKVTSSGKLKSAEEIILGCTPDGEIVSPDYRYGIFTGNVRFYKNGESRTISITPKLRKLSYSQADNCLYAYDMVKKDIIKITTDGTETAVCRISERSEFMTILPERDIFLTREPSAELGFYADIACRSLQSGEILWQKPIGSDISAGFTNGCVFVENTILDPTPHDDVDERGYASFVLSLTNGEILGGSRMPDALSDYTFNQTGDFHSAYSACITGKSPDAPEGIRFTDLTSGKYDELLLPAQDIIQAIPYFAADTGCWITAYTRNEAGGASTEICLCNPAIDSSSPSAETADIPTVQEPHKCDPSLADAQKLADYIEQKYGVCILIGNEVLDIPVKNYDTIVTTEGLQYIGSYGPGPLNYYALDSNDVLIKLAVIEQKMSKYPEGFFRGFQTPEGKGGLRISLYQQLYNEGTGDAGGDSSETGAWYEMRLVNEYAFDHEMFHIVEFRLDYMLGGGDNFPFPDYGEDSWMDLCPPNFKYSYDYSNCHLTDKLDKYILKQMGDNAYFISRYSTVSDFEDRAELVSGLFEAPDAEWNTENYPNMLVLYQNSPHLKKKLDRIAERLRSEFGSVYWEEIYDAGFDPFVTASDIWTLTGNPDSILSHYGL